MQQPGFALPPLRPRALLQGAGEHRADGGGDREEHRERHEVRGLLHGERVERRCEEEVQCEEGGRVYVEKAGLTDQVEFHVEDSLSFLERTADEVDQFDFILIDDDHDAEHVIKELAIVCPKIAPRTGKIYFDNTSGAGVNAALQHLKETYGGDLLTFPNCSHRPPGNAIWQPG